jgi:hypothetical protein
MLLSSNETTFKARETTKKIARFDVFLTELTNKAAFKSQLENSHKNRLKKSSEIQANYETTLKNIYL